MDAQTAEAARGRAVAYMLVCIAIVAAINVLLILFRPSGWVMSSAYGAAGVAMILAALFFTKSTDLITTVLAVGAVGTLFFGALLLSEYGGRPRLGSFIGAVAVFAVGFSLVVLANNRVRQLNAVTLPDGDEARDGPRHHQQQK